MAVPVGAGTATSQEDQERKKRTRNLVILLVVLLVTLIVIAFFLLRSVGVFGSNVSVPNVVGLTTGQATQTLHNDHLTVGSSTVRASSTTKGEVLSTDPKAGVSVSKNSAVNLVVSGGPNIPTVVVPSVTGKQLTQAIALLQSANLGYTVHNVTSNQSVGTVLSQDPAGGTKTLETHKVTLTVSGTQTSVSVPGVVGQSPARAGSLLQQAGLTVGSQSTACSSQPDGVVSGQNPVSGASVPPNTSVNLVVSSGNCVSVPGVVGQSQSAATSAVTGAGLVANTTFDTTCAGGAQPGNVDSQSPGSGAQVNSGSTVNISVCQATTTTTTTTATPSTTTTTSATPTT
jgi:serine/threonine-protein kinase